jgi:hypothetical protein
MAEASRMDLLVAFDDQLCQRLQQCTYCGGSPVVSAGIWHCSDGEKTHTLTYVLCHRCVTSDLQRKGIDALLRQRYGFVDESPSI